MTQEEKLRELAKHIPNRLSVVPLARKYHMNNDMKQLLEERYTLAQDKLGRWHAKRIEQDWMERLSEMF